MSDDYEQANLLSSSRTIKIAIVDDQPTVRSALTDLILLEDDMQVVGDAATGYEAILLAGRVAPDVILMDLRMPGINGVQATAEILNRHPQIKVLLLTTFDEDELVLESIEAGASGYLLKDTPIENIVGAIRFVFSNGTQELDPSVAANIKGRLRAIPSGNHEGVSKFITAFDYQLLTLLCAGKTEAEAAAAMGIPLEEVAQHVRGLQIQLAKANKKAMIEWAQELI